MKFDPLAKTLSIFFIACSSVGFSLSTAISYNSQVPGNRPQQNNLSAKRIPLIGKKIDDPKIQPCEGSTCKLIYQDKELIGASRTLLYSYQDVTRNLKVNLDVVENGRIISVEYLAIRYPLDNSDLKYLMAVVNRETRRSHPDTLLAKCFSELENKQKKEPEQWIGSELVMTDDILAMCIRKPYQHGYATGVRISFPINY